MDTRDQALTKLTRLHDESHPTPHRPVSLWRNYSLPMGATWNCWWRRVVDDDDNESPSLEPQTDSRSAFPMKNRRWQRLRIMKRDETFSSIFSPKIGFYNVGIRVRGATRWAQPLGRAWRGWHALVYHAHPGHALQWFLVPVFFIYSKINLQKVSFQTDNFYFCTKTTPW